MTRVRTGPNVGTSGDQAPASHRLRTGANVGGNGDQARPGRSPA